MEYDVKKLMLFEDIFYSENADSINSEKMTKYISKVSKKDMNPKLEDYLTSPVFCGFISSSKTDGQSSIPKGTYAFIQSIFESEESVFKAAEALWLECVWQEYELVDNFIYLREIPHGDKMVFQLFRQINVSA